MLLAGLGRCHDYRCLDTVKHFAKYPEVTTALYKQFGILNMFSPDRPNGTYELNLAIYEEKQVAKLLCELCKAEGWNCMTSIKIAGKECEKMSNDVMRSLPDAGLFVCTYECAPEKIKEEAREKMG